MSDVVREKLKKIGVIQKRIILWVGDKEGITEVYHLRSRYPSTEEVYVPSVMERVAQSGVSLTGKTEQRPTKYAPYLEHDYFRKKRPTLADKGWIEWNPEAILGHKPSPLESTALSKGIRGLEKRGLIELAKESGKNRRVSHVRLTFHGSVASVLLRQS